MYRLREFAGISALDYVCHRPQFYVEAMPDSLDQLMTSSAVFRTVNQVPYLLLLQRSETDSLPGQWELPGGAVDASDATLRDAVARELQEETGLTLAWVIQEIGQPVRFAVGGQSRARVAFVVEVDEIGRLEFQKTDQLGELSPEDVARSLAQVHVVLNPKEHQRYRWVTRADVESMSFGGRPIRLAGADTSQKMLLQAFDIQDAVLVTRQDAPAGVI